MIGSTIFMNSKWLVTQLQNMSKYVHQPFARMLPSKIHGHMQIMPPVRIRAGSDEPCIPDQP